MAKGIAHIDVSRHLGVLSAFSQAQKEHRRHSIHLATLRAQGKGLLFFQGRLPLILTLFNSEKDRER